MAESIQCMVSPVSLSIDFNDKLLEWLGNVLKHSIGTRFSAISLEYNVFILQILRSYPAT